MNKQYTKKIVYGAVLSAIAIVLAYFVRFPIFPSAAFLEYDMADVPIFVGTLCFGTGLGLIITVVVSVLQGLFVSAQSGWVGVVMHILATGTFVLIAGAINDKRKEKSTNILSLLLGSISMVLVMIPLNLVFSSFFYMKVPLDRAFFAMLDAVVAFPKSPTMSLLTGACGALAFSACLYAVIAMKVPSAKNRKSGESIKISVWTIVKGIMLGVVYAALIVLPMNLLFGSVTFDLDIAETMEKVVVLLWTVIVPFNAIKAFGNAIIAFLINTQVGRFLKLS